MKNIILALTLLLSVNVHATQFMDQYPEAAEMLKNPETLGVCTAVMMKVAVAMSEKDRGLMMNIVHMQLAIAKELKIDKEVSGYITQYEALLQTEAQLRAISDYFECRKVSKALFSEIKKAQ